MSASSVPQIQFTSAGLILPAEADILAGVQADINAAFGGVLSQSLETPQGQLASTEAAVIADKNSQIAYIVNQIDPQYSADRFQDAIGRIYFLTRKPATSTIVDASLTGVAGATIPAGSLAQDTSGNLYSLLGNVTLDAHGQSGGDFAAVNAGPIPCPPLTLTKIYQAVSGWDSVTNPYTGTIGDNVESRAEFEFRRKNSVAKNAKGTPAAIYSAVSEVEGVIDCYVIDNPTGTAVITGSSSYSVAAHSVYVAVLGGTDDAVAKAIWSKKDAGCDYGADSYSTTVVVTDDSGYSYPQPAYNVKFLRPGPYSIHFDVQIINNPNLPYNTADLIKSAIVARFYGQDGTTRERIGGLITASRYYGAILSAVPDAAIISVLVGHPTATSSSKQVGIEDVPSTRTAIISVTLV